MNILVTGGLGYLGSIVVEKLIENGFKVKILDSLIYGNFLSQKGRNFELIKGDIRNNTLLTKAIEDVDAVIHLAGIIGTSAVNLDKELTIEVNYLATRRLAELCSKKKLKLVFSSTCSVYGARPDELIREKSQITPLELYAMSKLVAEEAIAKRCNDYVIFRLGTLYGLSPRMRFDLVMNRFIAQAIQDRKITVYGGTQRRPFVHVQDVADVFVRALNSGAHGIYNMGGTNFRIREVAEIISQKTGCSVSVLGNLKDPRDYAVDSTLAEKTFGFKNASNIKFAVDEITGAYRKGIIKDYKEPIFNNEEWLKKLWM